MIHRMICLLALLVLLPACQRATVTTPAAPLRYLGSVQDVIKGVVNEDGRSWHAAECAWIGFGAGSPRGLDSLGEYLFLHGTAYAKSTDADSPDFFRVIHGPRFVSTCSLYIPHDATALRRVRFSAATDDEVVTLGRVYEMLMEASGGQAYAFAGLVDFATVEALAVSRPPIHGEDLFANRERYYTEGPTSLNDLPGVIMGAAADFAREGNPERRELLGRILYDNPYDQGGGLSVHSHALLLHAPVEYTTTITPTDVRDVNHLLSQSRIRTLDVLVYSLESLEPLEE
jgi:hypothetical protein